MVPRKLAYSEIVDRIGVNMESGGTLAGSRHYIVVLETRAEEMAAELDAEKAIWASDPDERRHQGLESMHACIRQEHMDSIIRNEKYLRIRTGLGRVQFLFLVTLLLEQDRLNGSTRLWRSGSDRASDPGNRCLLSMEQAVLLYMTRIKTGRVQEDLEVEFGVEQSTISRYLDSVEEMLEGVLPTARNVVREMKGMGGIKQLSVLIPGFDGTVIVDGTHSRIRRPSDPDARRKAYSGKKAFTFNTAVFVTTDGRIVGISDTEPGTTHDITELRGALPQLEVIGQSMLDAGAQPHERLELMGDSGYQGAAKYCPGANVTTPIKKPKGRELTAEQKAYNKELGSKRAIVEHVIGDLKEYRILANVFVGTAEQYNKTFNVITGIVNFKRMWPSRSSADRKGGTG